ncbi:hypothetical protein ANCCAN_27435 [Ancylostoma caninum]|uniref:Uncharacterized protein n=1 Tax=Ancylostoma caninum TaxID=29170 RepID=A0A368F9I4_ANCCA|nr:hypothetical protein ANCCAN_27435 [Ancylostoma caninum]
MKLPKGAYLGYANLVHDWLIEERPPFKLVNLKELMLKWSPSGRCHKEDYVTQCMDFVCFYLVRACDPPERIQKYSCRVSSRGGKKEDLEDLPEEIVFTLIGCLGLGQPELEMSAEDLKMRRRNSGASWGRRIEFADNRSSIGRPAACAGYLRYASRSPGHCTQSSAEHCAPSQ